MGIDKANTPGRDAEFVRGGGGKGGRKEVGNIGRTRTFPLPRLTPPLSTGRQFLQLDRLDLASRQILELMSSPKIVYNWNSYI